MELTSQVKFAGSWNGAVMLKCTRPQARHLAARFLSLPSTQIEEQIACDVLGELTNMIAGNLKPLFGPDIQLSLASVSSRSEGPTTDFSAAVHEEISFCSAEGCLLVKILAVPAAGQG